MSYYKEETILPDNYKFKPDSRAIRNFDFTRLELEYIREYANFTQEDEKIFEMLTTEAGRTPITIIANSLHLSDASIKKKIRYIKDKIKRLICD